MNKILKTILIIVVIGALVFVGVTMFGDPQTTNTATNSGLRSTTNSQPLSVTQTNTTANPSLMNTEDINREFVAMLLNLEAIRLNDDIFSEPAFRVLRDNSIRLNQPGNEGRPNPFAPIGLDIVSRNQNSASVINAIDSVDSIENIDIESGSDLDASSSSGEPVAPGTLSDEQFESLLSDLNAS